VTRAGLSGKPRRRGGRRRPPLALALKAAAAGLTVALAAAVGPTAAWADGDPASDYLLTQNVFVPAEAQSQAAATALEKAVDAVYLDGARVKVAVIYAPVDLGSVPSLFGNPGGYAQFLGLELSLWYVGPLLVVMPSGFGVYDGGRPVAAAEAALQSLSPPSGSADDLVGAATDAVAALDSAHALDSPDVRAPLVTAHPATAVRGKLTTLRFDVFDDSGRSSALVRVLQGRALLDSIRSPSAFAVGTRSAQVTWRVPTRLRTRGLRFCVVASDPAGNRSRPACAPFLRVR
jgi:hypothetical protein